MAAKQGKKDYPTMVLNILGTSVAALPLDEEIRSQKSEVRNQNLFSGL